MTEYRRAFRQLMDLLQVWHHKQMEVDGGSF
jgi:hypothetical protein